MSPAACVFAVCSTSSADVDAEVILSRTPSRRSAQTSGFQASELNSARFLQEQSALRSPAACQRKPLKEILAGLSPQNPSMPRQVTEAFEFKKCEEEHQHLKADEYNAIVLTARGNHEHVDEETRKKIVDVRPRTSTYYAPRQCACDVQSRLWQWLKIAV